MKDVYDIIDRTHLTEKASMLSEKHNKYVFRVHPKANKIQIKQAVETIFKKTVLDVNTSNYAGKFRRQRTVHYGRTPHWKKAIVTLKEGDKIPLA